jgi:hypothetical protein
MKISDFEKKLVIIRSYNGSKNLVFKLQKNIKLVHPIGTIAFRFKGIFIKIEILKERRE